MESKISISTKNSVVRIELTGRLDATNAPLLADELKKLIGQSLKQIAFIVKDLEYISSAGLRAIIFANQKLDENTEVFLIAPQQPVLEVIKMCGLDTFVTIQDSFDD